MMEYKIITSGSDYALTNYINSNIAEGWVPQGGIAVFQPKGEKGAFLMQAMVRPDPLTDPPVDE